MAGPPIDDDAPVEASKASRSQIIVRVVGLIVVAGVLWLLFTQVADWDEVWAAIKGLTIEQWALLLVAALARFVVEAVLLVAVTPGLPWKYALPAYLAPAAIASVVPGPSDLAARYAMFRSWGLDGAQTSSSVILWLLYSTMAKITLPLIAAGLLILVGRSDDRVEGVAVIAVVVLIASAVVMWLLLRSEATARRLGSWLGTAAHSIAKRFHIQAPRTMATDLEQRFVDFRRHTGRIIKHRSPLAVPAALAQQAALFFILLASLRVVGITPLQLDWVTVFGAFALVQVITVIPITPSGLGVAEAAYVALLGVGAPAGMVSQVVAGTLIYRIFAWLIILPFGAVSWAWWSRTAVPSRHPTSAES